MFHSRSQVPGDGVIVGSAQTLAAAALEAIGKIRTAIGSITVMRADGEIVRVSVGDPVYRGDTIETEADGAVGITFADGTVFDLSAAARLVLSEFVCDPAGTPNSALFSLVQGAFAFFAGKVAKTGGLRIDTPFASIRGSARDRGVGVLTLAALTFAAIEESQAASRHDAFLDDGTITYKDLPHGTFEIVTRDGRVIMSDDPGETIVVDSTGAVTRIPNSSSRMAELQQAQHNAFATLSLGQEGGAAGGSGSPQFDIPVQLQPINFSPPRNDAPSDLVTTHITAASSGFIPELKPPEPKPPVPALGLAGFSMVTETFNTTGSTHLDTVASGTLTFTDFKLTTVSATMASMTWSGGATPPSGLAEVLAGALSITTESADPVSGSIATTFGAADHNFDFLAANETLTIVYDVTATDNSGVSLTRPVTITITGTNDAPVLAADASGPHTVTEGLNTTGTFVFTDVDLTDHHTVSMSVTSATWSGGATLPSGVAAALAGALSATVSDGTGPGSGSVAVTFSAADSAFDFLAAGQTLKITYNVTLADNSGVTSSQPVTVTITGTNDGPVIGGVTTGSVTEDVNVVGGDISTSGALTIADADQGESNFTVQTGTLGSSGYGTFTLAADGTWTYTASNSQTAIQQLNAGQSITELRHCGLQRRHRQPDRHRHHHRHQRRAGDHRRHQPGRHPRESPATARRRIFLRSRHHHRHRPGPRRHADASASPAMPPPPTTAALVPAENSVNVSALIAAGAISFDALAASNGESQTINWHYNPAAADLDWLRAGDTLTLTYVAQVNDGHGNVGAQNLVITITGTNDVPIIDAATNPGAIAEIAGDSSAQDIPAVNGTITITDQDLGDTLTRQRHRQCHRLLQRRRSCRWRTPSTLRR